MSKLSSFYQPDPEPDKKEFMSWWLPKFREDASLTEIFLTMMLYGIRNEIILGVLLFLLFVICVKLFG